MSLVNMIGFILYLLIIALIVGGVTLIVILVIDFALNFMPSRRHEMEQQGHAAILQQATRRKLSSRYPISPHRLNSTLKRTKSATHFKNNE